MRLLITSVLLALTLPAAAQAEQRVIVAFDEQAGTAERREARAAAGVKVDEQLSLPGTQVVSGDQPAAEVVRELEGRPGVRYAEVERFSEITRTANDPDLAAQWASTKTDAPQAWDRTVGDPSVRIGVADTGIQLTHPDLAANVDTAADWDYVNGDADPADDQGHGTHVAGTIAASGDNAVGGAGVAWRSTLVALKVCSPVNGGATCSNARIAEAFQTATAKGLSVVNASFAGTKFSQAMREAIANNPNVLYVVAAGNDASNNDTTPVYPCSYDLPNIICVAASTSADGLAGYSNFGSASVDLAAPGSQILSTTLNSSTGYQSGTSMAAPQVAGAAALLKAVRPDATVAQERQALLDGAEVSGPFSGKTATGGRLNVKRSLDGIDQSAPAPAAASPVPAPVTPVQRATEAPPTQTSRDESPPAPSGAAVATRPSKSSTRAKRCKTAKSALKKARTAKTRRTQKARVKKYC